MPFEWTTNRQFTAPSGAAAVSVTPNGTAWVNSDWFELIAAADVALVLTGLSVATAGDDVAFEVEIGVGAAASEAAITTFRGDYENENAAGSGYIPHVIPLDNIPLGSRVSVRMRKAGTSTVAWAFAITYLKKPILGDLTVTATPQTAVPAAADSIALVGEGPTEWANGAYVEMLASASAALIVTGMVLPALTGSGEWESDLSIGGSGSEAVVTTFRGIRTGFADGPSYVPLRNPLNAIPISSRIAGRVRETDVATGRVLSVALTAHEGAL